MGLVMQGVWTCDRCGAQATTTDGNGTAPPDWCNVTVANARPSLVAPSAPTVTCPSCSALVRAALTPPGQPTLTPTGV